MASKAIYTVVAIAGIAVASGAAWWYQKPKPGDGAATAALAVGVANGVASGSASSKSPAVEVARVEISRLTDSTQAVGSLRSRRGVVLDIVLDSELDNELDNEPKQSPARGRASLASQEFLCRE